MRQRRRHGKVPPAHVDLGQQWQQPVGRQVGRERVVSLRRGEGTYNPKSAWRFVDSRRRVLPDIDGKVHQVTEVIEVTFVLVESHFASVENNILSDIRNFHMKLIQAKVDNKTRVAEAYKDPFSQDQYRISSFVPERQRWSYDKVSVIPMNPSTETKT